jgi:hypothetical protein
MKYCADEMEWLAETLNSARPNGRKQDEPPAAAASRDSFLQ